MAKRAAKKKADNHSASKADADVDPKTAANEFIDQLDRLGVENVRNFQQELLRVLESNDNRPVTVRDLFKSFRRHSMQHNFLQSLRDHGIVRPQGGGQWTADRAILLTREGLELAQNCDVKTRPLVFVSYSRKDQEWRDRLVEHLSVLQQGFNLDVWYDQRVEIGGDWFAEIKDALERSTAAVLLISAPFLNSDFIKHEEIPQILGRGSEGFRVFPVLVRPCAWQAVDWLTKLQIRPNDGEALASDSDYQIDAHLAQITLEIYDILKNS